MMNERLKGLLAYLGELQRLQANGYTCINEINECIGMVKIEFAKKPNKTETVSNPNKILYTVEIGGFSYEVASND